MTTCCRRYKQDEQKRHSALRSIFYDRPEEKARLSARVSEHRKGRRATQAAWAVAAFLRPVIGEHVDGVHKYFDNLFSNQVSQRKFLTML